jgi:signal transduction histidine kinase
MAALARPLGHELNNIFGAMVLQLEILTQDVPPTGAARQSLAILETAARQGVDIVRRVRDLARLSRPLLRRPVDLRAVVDDALATVRARIDAHPGVAVTIEPGPVPRVLGDPGELALAVRELINNALDAVGAAGRIRIVTGTDGRVAVCRVVDDGEGVAADVRAHAFEPFVSTRPERGRGLGLTIALAVASRHGGEVQLAPAPHGGTVATLRLPRSR